MREKAHGSCDKPAMKELRWGCDYETTDRVCCFNRHNAEHSGYAFVKPRNWIAYLKSLGDDEVTYYDPVSGLPLFIAPRGRTQKELIAESKDHGWPSFRDEEVVWDNVRVIKSSGEAVSTVGVHLGHNLPDSKGNRYCINLVSCCGMPPPEKL